MNIPRKQLAYTLILLAATAPVQSATTDLADAPLVTSSSSSVRPNIMFVLDDSGSMGWNYLPDWANSGTVALFRNADYNGVYYDPAVRYDPPTAYNANGTLNTSTYPDMDGLTTTTGADTTTKPNWKAVPDDGYGIQSTAKSNLVGNAYFYTFIPGEYCTSPNLKTCNAQTAPTAAYPYAAKLRWCNSTALTNCQASYISGSYTNARYPGLSGVPGSNQRTDIVSTNNSYPYPGTSTKAASRTDCAGTTCTYTEEMNNYANWWAYYHTRMQMMKTAASIAFATLNDSYRTSYMSINNNTSSDFLNFGTNNNTQKYNWYNKLFAANPGNRTPLREALSNAGRLYAGKYNGTTFNGSTVTDPMEYSCQQNFTILSTDGYWNGNTGFKLNGTTAVGNQDGTEPRPMYDGANTTSTRVTPTTTVVQKETVGNATTTKVWARTVTSVSSTQNCSTGATSGGGSCIQDSTSNTRTWCMYTSSNVGSTGSCNRAGNTGSSAYACRLDSGLSQTSTNPDGAGCVSDANGGMWCLYTNNTTSGTTSCSQLQRNGNNVSGAYVCRPPVSNNGYTVTTQPQTYNQVIKGATTSVTNESTTVNQTITSINGVAGSPTYTTVQPAPSISTVSTTSSVISDTGAPTSSTTWTNGSSSTQCMTNPSAGGTSAATIASTSTTFTGTPTVTTLSTTVTVGSPTTSSSASGGTSDTLADVAEYYYVTDLRTTTNGNCTGAGGNTLCSSTSPDPYNNVPASGLDAAAWQHMTTFTLGLGASGYMQYLSSNYMSDTSGDFYDVKNGTAANPSGGICAWQSSGDCNWPTPAADSQANIDDLWHAAVNGRGTYYSATNPATLSGGLSGALAGVSARTGASAAATTSNPNVTSGDNFVFSSTFTTVSWDGELVRQQLDLTTGVTSNTIDWAAQARLDANATRKIYYFSSGATGNIKEFLWSNLNADGLGSHFTTPHISTGVDALSQFCTPGSLPTCLGASDQATASGQKLVDFLRGDRTYEGASTDLTKYYRLRTHVLGDIVNAEAVYVKNSLYNYSDFGYSSFVSTNSNRQGMVYAAANDGMLHAFYSADGRMDSAGMIVATGGTAVTGGEEAWAYVPSFVIPNLYKLADKDYSVSGHHRYFVDGTPVAGDICVSSCGTASAVWKTILVGGLNKGGRGYYALDVTNPGSPRALWEFTDTNMGNTYGNPKITKLKDGTWVVLVTSGYNNVLPGDGQGRLYVINAATGALIRSIATGVGDTITPSGLARISAMVVNTSSDNTVLQVYGGDLRGNLWRFDVNGDVGATGYDAQLLTTVSGPGGAIQPITTKPEIGKVSGNVVIYFGTGSYLGTADIGDTNQKSPHLQSFYAVKDPLSTGTTAATAIYSNPRSGGFIRQVQTTTTCPAGSPTSICTTGQVVRTSTNNSVNFASDNGWYIDLPDSGERANTDPTLALGTIGFTTNVPANDACSIGGYSYRYFLDYRTGGPVSSSSTGVAGAKLGNALATRPVYVRLPNNTVVELTRLSSGDTITSNVPIGSGALPTRRTSWRELTVE